MYAEQVIKDAFTQAMAGAVKEKGFTHTGLASTYGMPYRTFRRFLTGERDMTVQMFIRISHIIGMSTDEILGRVERALSEVANNVTDMFPGASGEQNQRSVAKPRTDGEDDPDDQ